MSSLTHRHNGRPSTDSCLSSCPVLSQPRSPAADGFPSRARPDGFSSPSTTPAPSYRSVGCRAAAAHFCDVAGLSVRSALRAASDHCLRPSNASLGGGRRPSRAHCLAERPSEPRRRAASLGPLTSTRCSLASPADCLPWTGAVCVLLPNSMPLLRVLRLTSADFPHFRSDRCRSWSPPSSTRPGLAATLSVLWAAFSFCLGNRHRRHVPPRPARPSPSSHEHQHTVIDSFSDGRCRVNSPNLSVKSVCGSCPPALSARRPPNPGHLALEGLTLSPIPAPRQSSRHPLLLYCRPSPHWRAASLRFHR